MGRDLVGRTSKPSLGLIFFGFRKILRKLEKYIIVELDVRLKKDDMVERLYSRGKLLQ